MKFNKKSTALSCLALFLSAALMVGCKPIYEKKPLPPNDDKAAAAPAPAPAPAAAPAPAPAPAPVAAPAPAPAPEPAVIEDVQSLESSAPTEAAAAPVVDDGDDVVKPNSAMMRDIQQALVNAGLNPGPVDGKSGARTVTAIETFQKQNGIPTGKIDKRTLRALGVNF